MDEVERAAVVEPAQVGAGAVGVDRRPQRRHALEAEDGVVEVGEPGAVDEASPGLSAREKAARRTLTTCCSAAPRARPAAFRASTCTAQPQPMREILRRCGSAPSSSVRRARQGSLRFPCRNRGGRAPVPDGRFEQPGAGPRAFGVVRAPVREQRRDAPRAGPWPARRRRRAARRPQRAMSSVPRCRRSSMCRGLVVDSERSLYLATRRARPIAPARAPHPQATSSRAACGGLCPDLQRGPTLGAAPISSRSLAFGERALAWRPPAHLALAGRRIELGQQG